LIIFVSRITTPGVEAGKTDFLNPNLNLRAFDLFCLSWDLFIKHMYKSKYFKLDKDGCLVRKKTVIHTKKFMLNRICYNLMGDKWDASEWRGNAIISLGKFDTKEEAIEAMKLLTDKRYDLQRSIRRNV
jgi:hypothetical protein